MQFPLGSFSIIWMAETASVSTSVCDVRENDGAWSVIATHTHAAKKEVSMATKKPP